ncbi:MAG TPA: tRNA lysidine(34) synthetase TilS [Oligoflexia bacterium]|nr:tRNA lysidine(34) synthetase TilS [Oligoflexia bacterium]
MIWDEVRRVFAACPPGDFARWLTSYPVPYRWRLVCLLAQKQLGDDALKLGYAQLRRAAELISSAASEERCLNLGFGISCHIRREDEVCFVRETLPEAVRRQPTARDSRTLGVPGELQFQFTPALRTSLTARLVELAPGRADELIEQVRVHGRGSLRHAKCFFDRRTLNAESLTVRFFQPGDAMDVWRRGRRKVKKLFQEQAVAPYLRCAVPIVEFAGRIIWVPGIARSNAAPLRRDTQSVLELEFRELD